MRGRSRRRSDLSWPRSPLSVSVPAVRHGGKPHCPASRRGAGYCGQARRRNRRADRLATAGPRIHRPIAGRGDCSVGLRGLRTRRDRERCGGLQALSADAHGDRVATRAAAGGNARVASLRPPRACWRVRRPGRARPGIACASPARRMTAGVRVRPWPQRTRSTWRTRAGAIKPHCARYGADSHQRLLRTSEPRHCGHRPTRLGDQRPSNPLALLRLNALLRPPSIRGGPSPEARE